MKDRSFYLTVLLAVLGYVFQFGVIWQKVDSLDQRLNRIEQLIDNGRIARKE